MSMSETNNLTSCKACGKEIAKGVNKCPHCGKDQRNFFMKHKILTGVLALVLIGAIGSALGGNNSSSKSTTDDNSSVATDTTKSATPETKKEKPKEFYAINEEVKLNNAVVKVTKVEKSNGGDFDKPKDGMEYVIVTVQIKNSGDSEISYNPFDFTMQNSKGQITNKAFTTIDSDTSLSSGNLAGGGEVSGTIAFEQPKNDNGLILKYKGNMFSNKEIQFKLN